MVSAGIHNMAIPSITDDQFFKNIAFYLQMLRSGCGQIVWVTMSNVEGIPKYLQNNDRIRRWNDGLLLYGFPEIAVVINVYPMSTSFSHSDNVHMEDRYYDELAKAFPM